MNSEKLFTEDTTGNYEREQVDRYVEMLQNAHNTMKAHVDQVETENQQLSNQLSVSQNAIIELQQTGELSDIDDLSDQLDELSEELMRANDEIQQLKQGSTGEMLLLKNELTEAQLIINDLKNEQVNASERQQAFNEEQSKQVGKIIIDANTFGDKIISEARIQAEQMVSNATNKVTEINQNVEQLKIELSGLKNELISLVKQLEDIYDNIKV